MDYSTKLESTSLQRCMIHHKKCCFSYKKLYTVAHISTVFKFSNTIHSVERRVQEGNLYSTFYNNTAAVHVCMLCIPVNLFVCTVYAAV